MADKREIKIKTPLGEDELHIIGVHGSEELGRLFQYELDLYSTNEEININGILGETVTVSLELDDGSFRYFNGFVSRFSQVGRTPGGYATYQAIMRPWFWFLTRTSDCRIFQEKTVPDIIKKVFGDNGFSDFEDALSGSYRTWEYCVQYRETDFNFISRLMEQEGIYYFFKHEEGKHMLVLADGYSSHEPIKGQNKLCCYLPGLEAYPGTEAVVSDWMLNCEVQPGAVALCDFDFKKPKTELRVNSPIPRDHAASDYEIFDYPGEFSERSDGDQYSQARIEELHVQFEQASALTNARTMVSGGLFELTEHPRADQNREYLVTTAGIELSSDELSSGSNTTDAIYRCNFTTIESKTPYRTSRLTPKPIVQGPQTAIVVGPSGKEIWTDEYGRVKVQFHWDRYGANDENSSCWMRVSQVWAGSGWGSMHIPRIGHEVIVEFLEGDPDRPIITGRVYNADNMPPYDLPANATQSGIKSRSSKEGGPDNFNEIRFEDKKGSEEVYIHAEKDQRNIVENDRFVEIGNNETVKIGTNRAIEVGANHSEKITGNSESEILGSKIIKIAANKEEKIGGPAKVETGGDKQEINWSISEKTTYGVTDETYIGAKFSKNLAVTNEVFVGAKISNTLAVTAESFVGAKISVCKAKEVKTTPTLNELIQTASKHKCATYELEALSEMTLYAGSNLKLECGGSSITITPGSIVIKSSSIKLDGKVEEVDNVECKKKLKTPSFEAN